MEDPEKSARDAAVLKRAGGCTIIDAQPGGCNRMADGLQKISEESGLQILCSTGFHKLVFYPEGHWIFRESEETIAAFFLRELTQGVDNHCDRDISGETAGQKAGLIKCALDTETLTPRYRLLFRAAAEAALQADRILMIHIEQGSDPQELLDFLLSLGMPADRLVFCHLDRAVPDLQVHTQILESGAFLEFDTIGRFKYHSDERELEIFRKHIEDGFGRQLLFSLDTTRARLASYGKTEIGLDYICRVFLRKMRDAGITEEEIRRIAVENPRRALTGSGGNYESDTYYPIP